MSRSALGGFILINIVVSLGVVFGALFLWDNLNEPTDNSDPVIPEPRPIVITTTPLPGQLPASALQGTVDAQATQIAALIANPPTKASGNFEPTAVANNNGDNNNNNNNNDNPLPTIPSTSIPDGVPTLPNEVFDVVTIPAANGQDATSVPGNTGAGAVPTDDEFPGCERYIVEAGDNCSVIAAKLDVDLFDLLTLNGLDESCLLQIDQALLVPGAQCSAPPTETPTLTPTNTPFVIGTFAITNTALPTAVDAQVQILSVANYGDVAIEQVEIANSSDAVVPLRDWTLSDAQGNEFVFPDLLIQPGQKVIIFSASGENTPVALYWGQNAPVWTVGETVILADEEGVVQAVFTVGDPPITLP